MSDFPHPPPTPTARPHSIWHNWISLSGVVLAGSSLFAFLLLFAIDLAGRDSGNPYLGILCYVVAPFFLILGATVTLFGAWLQRRRLARSQDVHPARLAIDLSRPRDRRILLWFALGSASFLLLTAIGSYQTYVYTESNQFCGEACHTVMGPEYTAYHRSAHARVACVECHVGSGATWYIKSKINGTRQLYGVLTGQYSRPIPAPVQNMRPAGETCEQCHWPQKYSGSIERTFNRYLADAKNTPYAVRLLVNVGGGSPANGPVGGIHWHMNVSNKVEYYATDVQRQVIPWIRVTGPDGKVTVYRTQEFKGDPDPASIRRMDCIDCHNRPAHRYASPDDAVDEAMDLGHIDSKLPSIKRTAVDLLTKTYSTQDEATGAIGKALDARYAGAPGLDTTVEAVEAVYRVNFFPEMKADWSKYPDNIGHLDSAGCFRCHDAKHSVDGLGKQMPSSDCNVCHTILAQGSGAELSMVSPSGQVFRHPSTSIDGLGLLCSDCHNGKNQDN
jgi:nitrate/TMAO reductase-like tetraheme cytochrome c subunit